MPKMSKGSLRLLRSMSSMFCCVKFPIVVTLFPVEDEYWIKSSGFSVYSLYVKKTISKYFIIYLIGSKHKPSFISPVYHKIILQGCTYNFSVFQHFCISLDTPDFTLFFFIFSCILFA
jgi:hypothetical protein